MSGINRGKFTAIGLIVGSILAVLISIAVVWWGQSQTAEYQQEANYRTAQEAKDTYNQIRQTCLTLTAIEKANCIAIARREQRAYAREEQDLVAQRQTALWTYITGAAAVFGIGLSIVGVFLVWITFHETRRGTYEAMRSANEAEESRKSFIESERGHVKVNGVRVRLDVDHIDLAFRVENIGKALVEIDGLDRVVTYNPMWANNSGEGPPIPLQVKLQGGSSATVPDSIPSHGTATFFLHGFLRYRTLTLKDCKTHFSYRIDLVENSSPLSFRVSDLGNMWRPSDT